MARHSPNSANNAGVAVDFITAVHNAASLIAPRQTDVDCITPRFNKLLLLTVAFVIDTKIFIVYLNNACLARGSRKLEQVERGLNGERFIALRAFL